MQFDHLVLGANSLAEGQSFLEDTLGVMVPKGGQHQRFGTHNAVMRLNSGGYLEIIAIDPDAEPQNRPRWFSLDDSEALEQIRSEPKLLTWVVNTGSRALSEVQQEMPDSISTAANPLIHTPMRRGDLHWNMLIPADGQQSDLLFPWLIEWPGRYHPSENMVNLQCEVLSIIAWHQDPSAYSQSLQQIQCDQMLSVKNAVENTGKMQLEVQLSGPTSKVVLYGLEAR